MIVFFLDNSFCKQEILSFKIPITEIDAKEFLLMLFCGEVCPLKHDIIASSSPNNFFPQTLEIL